MKKCRALTGWTVVMLFLFGPAQATVWYVHPDSTLNSIQAGLNLCSTHDTVLVGPGTYYENIVWPDVQGIDLISEYGPETTIVDGSGSAEVIKIFSEIDSMTVISNFTIQHGHTDFDGGGICCFCASPFITGNTIIDNTADYGAGIGCYKVSAIITGNTISGNTAVNFGGGIHCSYACGPTIANNTITGNTAQRGGGISLGYLSGSESVIIGNTITGNTATQYGGGIDCDRWSSPHITVNTITGNTAQGGGGIHCSHRSSPTITANTIAANMVTLYGGGISCDSSSPVIAANTITANCSTGVYCKGNASPLINYNNITNNTGYGVCNLDSYILVNAEYNWWGDPTGPYHPGLNPGGLGNQVSDNVDFMPWLDGPYGVEEQETSETVFTTLQVSPNPFSKLTHITFQTHPLPGQETSTSSMTQITLSIYDASGRLVRQWDYPTVKLSDHVCWYGRDDSGRQLPSGVFFLKFTAGGHTETRKLLLVR